MCRTSDAAVSGSKITGTSTVFTRRAPRRGTARRDAADVLRPIESIASARHVIPVVALHLVVLGRDRRRRQVERRGRVAAGEPVAAGIRVPRVAVTEVAAFRVLDARIGLEGRRL